jgi:hypothetical protein
MQVIKDRFVVRDEFPGHGGCLLLWGWSSQSHAGRGGTVSAVGEFANHAGDSARLKESGLGAACSG